MIKMLMLGIVAPLMVMMMAGCNTMEGLGQDVQTVGGKIENSADRNKTR